MSKPNAYARGLHQDGNPSRVTRTFAKRLATTTRQQITRCGPFIALVLILAITGCGTNNAVLFFRHGKVIHEPPLNLLPATQKEVCTAVENTWNYWKSRVCSAEWTGEPTVSIYYVEDGANPASNRFKGTAKAVNEGILDASVDVEDCFIFRTYAGCVESVVS